MELQQLRYVVAIADERSFTRVAERCFVVQSALSHQVKALEREIGTALFVRSSRRVDLTAAGEAFTVAARASLAAAERAITAAAEAVGEVRGSLSIGAIPTVTTVDVPSVVAHFHEMHPRVDVTIRTGGSDDFMHAIGAGALDVAFLGLAATSSPMGVAARQTGRTALTAVLPADHALAGRKRLRLRDLADETFIDFPAGSPGRRQGDSAFADAGLHRRVAFEAMSTEFMVALVEHGLGVCLLPEGATGASANISIVTLVDGPRRAEHIAWDEFNPSPAALAFVHQVTARAA